MTKERRLPQSSTRTQYVDAVLLEALEKMGEPTCTVAILIMEGRTLREACKIAKISMRALYMVHLPIIREALKEIKEDGFSQF